MILAFAPEGQLEQFESSLARRANGEQISNVRLVYALQDLGRWNSDDRTGGALKRDGFPDGATIVIDVDLWPVFNAGASAALRQTFEGWLEQRNATIVDAVRQPYLTVYRVKCERAVAEDLLRYRDVRPVDLPPRIGLERGLLAAPVQDLAEPASPPPNSPAVVVLDTGIVAGHPVLAPAVGDGQSFLPGIGADDRSGHGPSVSGSAL